MKAILSLASALLLLSCGSSHSQFVTTWRVQIVERGLYEARTDTALPSQNGLWVVRHPRLIASTTAVPMRQGVRFGFRYILQGVPNGQAVPVELVTRYPSPGRWDESARAWRTESRYQVRLQAEVVHYRDFQLLEPEELIPGLWVFEFWQGAAKLGEQRFCVLAEEQAVAAPLSVSRSCLARTS